MTPLLALAGLAMVAFGLLSLFAGMMSDAPEAGDRAAKTGFLLMLAGAVSIAASVAWWIVT